MTRQTWIALVSAVLFVGMAATLALVPVPFVTYAPGDAHDVLGRNPGGEELVRVDDVRTFPTEGQLSMTTVSVTRPDSRVGLPEAVLGYWLPSRDAMPRGAVYSEGSTPQQVRSQQERMMDTSEDDATVAALRAAGEPVTAMPRIAGVMADGPSQDRLRPGDLVLSVAGEPVAAAADVGRLVRSRPTGSAVEFRVVRDGREVAVDVVSVESHADPTVPVVGINVDTGYRYAARVGFGVDDRIGGPSAGLVFALAVYDKITPGALLAGQSVAGTGTIDPDGRVGSIGGIQQKVAAAERARATAFLVPAANCRDVAGLETPLELVRVETLDGAVDAIEDLRDPATRDRVPRCG